MGTFETAQKGEALIQEYYDLTERKVPVWLEWIPYIAGTKHETFQLQVKDLVAECEAAFPLHGTKAAFYLLSHESIDRVSGTAFSDNLYKESGKEVLCPCGCGKKETIHPLATCVVLSGKRIPPIPAMTRYLVPHEYGHMVWYHVSRMLGYRETDDSKFYEFYMKTRGVEDYQLDYAGGKWHKNPGEIIANDFRLVFTNHEREFWPHSIPYPEETPIVDWWKEIHKQAIRIEATT